MDVALLPVDDYTNSCITMAETGVRQPSFGQLGMQRGDCLLLQRELRGL